MKSQSQRISEELWDSPSRDRRGRDMRRAHATGPTRRHCEVVAAATTSCWEAELVEARPLAAPFLVLPWAMAAMGQRFSDGHGGRKDFQLMLTWPCKHFQIFGYHMLLHGCADLMSLCSIVQLVLVIGRAVQPFLNHEF